MKLRFLVWWDAMRTSFWFVPALMTSATVALWVATIYFDRQLNHVNPQADRWFWSGGPEGARAILGAIASSTITVTGLVFSITMVVLTLATQKFGPRLLRSFMYARHQQSSDAGPFCCDLCLLLAGAVDGAQWTEPFRATPFLDLWTASGRE